MGFGVRMATPLIEKKGGQIVNSQNITSVPKRGAKKRGGATTQVDSTIEHVVSRSLLHRKLPPQPLA